MKKVILNFKGERHELTSNEAPEQAASGIERLVMCSFYGCNAPAKRTVIYTNISFCNKHFGMNVAKFGHLLTTEPANGKDT